MEQQLHASVKNRDLRRFEEILNDYPDVDVNWYDRSSNMSVTPLLLACKSSCPIAFAARLLAHPNVDVNWNDWRYGSTALNEACKADRADIVKLLLAHPNIDVNEVNNYHSSPLATVCSMDSTACAKLLLLDPRVDREIFNCFGYTRLSSVIRNGYLDIVKWWLVTTTLPLEDGYLRSAIETAKSQHHDDGVVLVEEFIKAPWQTRTRLRVELGMDEIAAADIFSLVIFLSDGLVTCNQPQSQQPQSQQQTNDEVATKARLAIRFFRVALQLPMELQMLLCHRVVGSTRRNIKATVSERAFRNLAGALAC